MASPTASVEADRRKYARLVANIDDAHYPLFQAAITGRAALEGATVSGEQPAAGRGSLIELGENNAEEKKRMRNAMVQQEGLMVALFEILRNVPRRGAFLFFSRPPAGLTDPITAIVLMLFKVNDLNRALDVSLQTTHSPARIFLIIAKFVSSLLP